MSQEELGNLGCRDWCQERNWAIWGVEIDAGEELGNLGCRDWCRRGIGQFGVQRLMSRKELGNLGWRDWCQERTRSIWGAEIDVRRGIWQFGVQRLMSGEEFGSLGCRVWCHKGNLAVWGAVWIMFWEEFGSLGCNENDVMRGIGWWKQPFLFLIFRDRYGYPSLTSIWLNVKRCHMWLNVKRCPVPHLSHKFVHNLWCSWSEELGDESSLFYSTFSETDMSCMWYVWYVFNLYVIVTQCQKVPSPTPIAQICS